MKANSIANISATPQRNVRRKRDDASKPLTASQQRWYDACLKVASKIDGKVNLKEVCAAAGFSSTDSAHNAMQSLMRKGLIHKRGKAYHAYSGSVVEKLWRCRDEAVVDWMHDNGIMPAVIDELLDSTRATLAAIRRESQ